MNCGSIGFNRIFEWKNKTYVESVQLGKTLNFEEKIWSFLTPLNIGLSVWFNPISHGGGSEAPPLSIFAIA